MLKKIIDNSILALNPIDRVSEILTAIVMLLTFVGSLSVATTGRQEMHAMLVGAVGCNVAWGIIDAVLYLMDCLAEKRTALVTLRAVRTASDSTKTRQLIADSLPSVVASIVEPQELETLHQRLKHLPAPPEHVHLDWDDWRRRDRDLFAHVPEHTPDDRSVRFHARQNAGFANHRWHCHRDVVCRRLSLRPLDWQSALRIGLALVAIGVALVAMTMALGG